ncbi:MAG: uncharacterized protein KVP18_003505 [Porospora cf. gigantea A]|uniref:uncharacterized protein n=1 Tax=Porospora cf. gigantea A TaxID=2853593 RepID=UPI00355A0769|nr:MAG: hypothetical protein KVP18_003505 [Porospora cf. gigantea A]
MSCVYCGGAQKPSDDLSDDCRRLAELVCFECCLKLLPLVQQEPPLVVVDHEELDEQSESEFSENVDLEGYMREWQAAFVKTPAPVPANVADPCCSDLQYQLHQKNVELCITSQHLQSLLSMSVLNEGFHIWQTDAFGTINSCRIGRRPTGAADQVPWFEVNRALGFLCHLYDCLVRKATGVAGLDKYTCQPQGSRSSIRVVRGSSSKLFGERSTQEAFALYWQDSSLMRLNSPASSFNAGLEALLDVFVILADTVEGSPPYAVIGNTVGNYPIEFSFDDEAVWTAAWLRFLTNTKWLTAKLVEKTQSDDPSKYSA